MREFRELRLRWTVYREGMNIAVSHKTALEQLRRLARSNRRLAEAAPLSLPQKVSARESLNLLSRSLQEPCNTSGSTLPGGETTATERPHALDILVPSAEARRNTPLLHCHIWSAKVPPGSFLRLSPDAYLSTPEFVFLQMADSLDIIQLIQLGYELCGRYVFDPTATRGWAKTANPLTTPERISAFLAGAPVCRGRKKAMRAVKFVLANSWSPMESDLSILLILPTRSGGYQMPAPLLNRKIQLEGDHLLRAHRDCYYLDLSWEDGNSRIHALEYQGYEDHSGALALGRDRTREIILDELGIHRIAITEYQAFRVEEFDTVVKALCKSIGRKYRKPTPNQMDRKRKLHRELFCRFGPDALVS